MKRAFFVLRSSLAGLCLITALSLYSVSAAQDAPRAFIDGTGPGWRTLTEQDFVDVNGDPETWTWKEGQLFPTGKPIGVLRSRETFKNFEMVIQWRHLRAAGNSGVFVWVPMEALETLKPGDLPEYVCTISRYRIVFTWSVGSNGRIIYRHLSISSPRPKTHLPIPYTCWWIASLFGFTGFDPDNPGDAMNGVPEGWQATIERNGPMANMVCAQPIEGVTP